MIILTSFHCFMIILSPSGSQSSIYSGDFLLITATFIHKIFICIIRINHNMIINCIFVIISLSFLNDLYFISISA